MSGTNLKMCLDTFSPYLMFCEVTILYLYMGE